MGWLNFICHDSHIYYMSSSWSQQEKETNKRLDSTILKLRHGSREPKDNQRDSMILIVHSRVYKHVPLSGGAM
jgi:hypothetical protein